MIRKCEYCNSPMDYCSACGKYFCLSNCRGGEFIWDWRLPGSDPLGVPDNKITCPECAARVNGFADKPEVRAAFYAGMRRQSDNLRGLLCGCLAAATEGIPEDEYACWPVIKQLSDAIEFGGK